MREFLDVGVGRAVGQRVTAPERRQPQGRYPGRLIVRHAGRPGRIHRAGHDPVDGALQRARAVANSGRSVDMDLAEEVSPLRGRQDLDGAPAAGVTFHNGKSVTPDDVVFSLKRIVNPKSPGNGASALAPLDVAAIKVLDSRTLQLPMKVPYASFLEQIRERLQLPDHPGGLRPQEPGRHRAVQVPELHAWATNRVHALPELPPARAAVPRLGDDHRLVPPTPPPSTRCRAANWTSTLRRRSTLPNRSRATRR